MIPPTLMPKPTKTLRMLASVLFLPLLALSGEPGVGDRVPDAPVRRVDGSRTNLRDLTSDAPSVLVFYRGGWCPYCNRHLSALKDIEPDLKKLGYRILAVSPDRPDELRKSVEKQDLTYTLLSDSSMSAARAFGLAFEVDPQTLKKYGEYGIDLEAASGETHRQLPHPAAYLTDDSGTIRFTYVNKDYKVRIDNKTLLEEARKAAAGTP